MKVLGIAGSPRRGGNSDLLLEQAMAGAKISGEETETIILCEMKIAPCLHCDGCLEKGQCVINDDMQLLYPKLRRADRIIIASPIFFMGVTAQAKAMIDRCQALWALKYVLKQPLALNDGKERKGLFISAGGTGFSNLFQPAISTIKSWFTVLDVKPEEALTFARIDQKDAIKTHPTALKDAFEAGRKLVTG